MAIRRTTATPKAIIELIVKGYVFTLVNILTKHMSPTKQL